MRIDSPVLITQVPTTVFGAYVAPVYEGLRELLRERCLPSFVEVLVISALGMFCGFMLIAYALQAILVACVMAVGTTWGMVLGLIMDRLYQAQL
jgi:hypothetical protein